MTSIKRLRINLNFTARSRLSVVPFGLLKVVCDSSLKCIPPPTGATFLESRVGSEIASRQHNDAILFEVLCEPLWEFEICVHA